jgi:hypothetical protein
LLHTAARAAPENENVFQEGMAMLMLMMRPAGQRVSGEKRRVPIVRERGRKYGPILKERCLSIKQDILVSGPNSSGKTRWLAKFDERAGDVWIKREKIFLRAMEPLQRWYEDPRVIASAAAKGLVWVKMRSYEKVEALMAWFRETKPVLLLDDAHKLAGRKLDIVIQLCREAGRLVVGTFAEQATPMSLRMLIETRDPQKIQLKSEAAYDVTSLAIWLMILLALMAGWWQLAAVLGGMKVLAGGRRAARQA